MLTYALIGLGGALGSIARAWLGTAMTALTGASFPWGTMLINVVGSFVIGFFGTLTATDGRFGVAPDLRSFVMIGICGGFTTFSSFSLQTLDLLRDGRPGQALGNIALSVVLCIGSVAIGYSAALALRTSRLAVVGAAAAGTMGDSVVVALHRPERVGGMLSAAAQMLALGEGGQVTALAIDEPLLASLQPTEEVMTQERRDDIAARRADWVDTMRRTLDDWTKDEREKGVAARWIEVREDAATAIVEHGRSAHILLLEQKSNDPKARARVHAALLHTGRPVLLVPAEGVGDLGTTIAVAWQDNRHVRQAVRTAAPLLAHARRIIIIRIDAGAGAAQELPEEFAGLPAELVTAPYGDEDIGTRLLSLTREAEANLLVMGSYGNGRLREKLFDGVTETILEKADLAVLMQHQDA